MESTPKYNALIKSIKDTRVEPVHSQNMNVEHKPKREVIGKVLLADLNLIPPTWTLLFRGKYLSRNIDMTKLLCSPEDPIIIYKGIVKLTRIPSSVQIDYTSIPQFEGSGRMTLEVGSCNFVKGLVKRVATELRKPHQHVKLIHDNKLMQLDERLEVQNLGTVYATIKVDFDFDRKISETYKLVCKQEHQKSIDRLVFVNATINYSTENGNERERQQVIAVEKIKTVGSLRRRICKVFKVNPHNHTIFRKGKPLINSDTLESQGLQEDMTICISGKLEKCDFRNVAKKGSLIKTGSSRNEPYNLRQRKAGISSINRSFSYFRRNIQRSSEKHLSSESEDLPSSEDGENSSDRENLSFDEIIELNEQKVYREKYAEEKNRRLLKSEKLKRVETLAQKKRREHPMSHGGGGPRPRPQSNLISAQDIDRKPYTVGGEKPTHNWNLYTFGMTLYGTCPNKECPSRKTKKKNNHGVSFQAGYGNILLTPERFKFPCPVCKDMFPGTEFVLCGGRSLFRFKKSGIGQPVKTVYIDCLNNIMKYTSFEKSANGTNVKLSNYDFIEITTVKWAGGLFSCVGCDQAIDSKYDEHVLRCGHAYHNECTPINVGGGGGDGDDDSTVGCFACNGNEVQLVYQMLGMETTNSDPQAACISVV